MPRYGVDIVFVVVEVERKGPGEVRAEHAVHEELAHLLHVQQYALEAGKHNALFAGHVLQRGVQGLLGAGLVVPEVHEVQSGDEAFHLQGFGILFREAGEFAGLGQKGQHVLVGEGQLEAGVAVEHVPQLGLVVPLAQAVVVAPVGHGFDDASHRIGRELGNDGRRRDEYLFRRHADDEREQEVQGLIVDHGHGDGQNAAEEVAHHRRFGEAAVDVVGRDVDAVGQSDDGEYQQGVVLYREAQHLAQEQVSGKAFQKDDRDARVHERVAYARPAHEALPAEEHVLAHAAAGDDGLYDVAHSGDAEPDGRAEPRQHPPFLSVQEGQQCGDEAHQHLEDVGERGVEVALARLLLLEGGHGHWRRGGYVVGAFHGDAAHGDDIALLLHMDILIEERPFGLAAHAEGDDSQRLPHPVAEAGGLAVFLELFVVGKAGAQRERHREDVLVAGKAFAGRARQGFGHGKAHAVAVPEVAGGVCAEMALQGGVAVQGLQGGYVAKDMLYLCTAFFELRRVAVQAFQHGAEHALEVHDVAAVDGDLQFVDLLDIGEVAVVPFLDVEKLEVRDNAQAVPDDLKDVLCRKAGELERYAVAASYAVQAFQQLAHGKAEQFGPVIAIVIGAGGCGGGQFRVLFRLQPRFIDGRGSEGLHAGDAGLAFVERLAVFKAGAFFLELGHAGLQLGQERLMGEFRQMDERGLAVAHESQKGFRIKGRLFDGELAGNGRSVPAVPQLQGRHDVLLHPERNLAAFFEEGCHSRLAEEFEEFFGVGEAAGSPDEFHIAAAEDGTELEADADSEAHDFGRPHELARCGQLHIVVVDHSEVAYAFDPCIHDEMRGALAALGIGIVDVVVHGELVPLFGHLDEVMLVEELAHYAGVARSRLAEVVDELELCELIVPRADDGLHDLDKDAARIVAEGGLRTVEHFFVQGTQGREAVFRRAYLVQAAQKVDDSLGHAELVRGGEVEYAVGVEACFEYFLLKVGGRPVVNDIIDHFQELTVLPVEIEKFSHCGHLKKMKNRAMILILSNCYILVHKRSSVNKAHEGRCSQAEEQKEKESLCRPSS